MTTTREVFLVGARQPNGKVRLAAMRAVLERKTYSYRLLAVLRWGDRPHPGWDPPLEVLPVEDDDPLPATGKQCVVNQHVVDGLLVLSEEGVVTAMRDCALSVYGNAAGAEDLVESVVLQLRELP